MLSVDQYRPTLPTVDIETLHGRARQSARRLAARKQRVQFGEMLPRMRAKNRYLATTSSAYVLPNAPVKISEPNETTRRDDDNLQAFATRGAETTVRPYYPRVKRVIPDHERPASDQNVCLFHGLDPHRSDVSCPDRAPGPHLS